MSSTIADFAGPEASHAPLYGVWDVDHILHVPWSLLPHIDGQGFLNEKPLWWSAWSIKFNHLTDLFVRVAPLFVLADPRSDFRDGRKKRLAWQTVIDGLSEASGRRVPFDDRPIGSRVDDLIRPYEKRLSRPALSLLAREFHLRLGRVEARDKTPVRFHPFSRDPAEDAPRVVAVDPLIRCGRPTIAGRGIPTDIVAERFLAGDGVHELAEDYGLTTPEVEEAIRFESLPPLQIPRDLDEGVA